MKTQAKTNSKNAKNKASNKNKQSKKWTLDFKLILGAGIVVGLAAIVFLAYFLMSYFHQKGLEQKSVELPGLNLYSVQQFDYNKDYSYYLDYPKNDDAAFDNAVTQFVDSTKSTFVALPSSQSSSIRSGLNLSYSINYYNKQFMSVDLLAQENLGDTTKESIQTILYDRQDKSIITMDKLFKDNTNYLAKLSALSRTALKSILGKNYNQVAVTEGTIPVKSNFDHFTVGTARHLKVIFDAGQVAPASLGAVTVSIPGSDLATILKQPYANDLLTIAAKPLAPPLKPLTAAVTKNGATPQADPTGADCSKVKCIALTFDDGPSYTTPDLLATLKANNVKATFFELGIQAQKYPSITKQVVDAGHVIGNHTFDHKDLETMPVEAARAEINSSADAIQAAGGVRPGLVRAPFGSISKSLAQTLNALFINWSIDPNDWKDKDSNTVYNRVIQAAKPGAIVLSHDIYPTTVDAYKRIIPELIREGYTLVTVPQLLSFGPSVAPGVYFSR